MVDRTNYRELAPEWAAETERRILERIRKYQGESFGGWGWVALPISHLPGNIPPYVIESMVERGILIEGRIGWVFGINGEVEDNGSQTGRKIKRGDKL